MMLLRGAVASGGHKLGQGDWVHPAGSVVAKGAAKVVVRFDQQQYKLLEFLRKDGAFGEKDGDIVANVVRAYLQHRRQAGGV